MSRPPDARGSGQPILSPVFQQDGSSGIASHSAATGGGPGARAGKGGPGRAGQGGAGRGGAGQGEGAGREKQAGGRPRRARERAGGGPGAGRGRAGGGPGGRGRGRAGGGPGLLGPGCQLHRPGPWTRAQALGAPPALRVTWQLLQPLTQVNLILLQGVMKAYADGCIREHGGHPRAPEWRPASVQS